ncbi:MAG: helix-turn-helix transcriptional regulator [Nitrososphaeria archaeon]
MFDQLSDYLENSIDEEDYLFNGIFIKIYREELHYSLHTVASLLGVTYQQVQKWENNTNVPNANYLYRLSVILQKSMDSFFA